jgi:hypothetical protein
VPPEREQRTEKGVARVGDRERKKRRRKKKKKEGRKIEKMNYLFFKIYDLQFILTILLLNNKNKM